MHAVRVFTRRHLGQIILKVRKLLPSKTNGMQISDIFNLGNYTALNSFMTERVAEHSDDGTEVDLKSMFTVAEMFVFFL